MDCKWMTAICFAAALLPDLWGAQRLTPLPDGLDMQALVWTASDEFCHREIRDGKTFFVIDVPRGKEAGMHVFSAQIDISKFRDHRVSFLIRYLADDVSAPPKPYWGSKFMLSYIANNLKKWPDADLTEGSSGGWKTGVISETFAADSENGELVLGLQEVSGRIEFDMSSLECGVPFSPDERVNLDYQVSYPDAVANAPRHRGVMVASGPVSDEMLQVLNDWNVNLIRAQITRNWGKIDTELDIEEYNLWLDRRLNEIEATATLAAKYNIKLVVDLHSPPGGRIDARNMRMFFEKKYADAFVVCWIKIATRFRGNPQIYAYDLVNEPVQAIPSPCDYWELQRRAAEAVRSVDPDTPIMIESNESDRPQTFIYLSPLRMDNVIYKVHMYFPLAFTHQRLRSEGPVISYPGVIEGEMWDREKIKATMQPVRDFQLRHKCKIYVGEFSAIVWAPGADQYIRDCISVFEEYGWDWTFHAFREWSGWSVEYDGSGPRDVRPAEDSGRKRALLDGLRLNRASALPRQ